MSGIRAIHGPLPEVLAGGSLYIVIKSKQIGRVAFIVRRNAERRLNKRCFRRSKRMAGNFIYWNGVSEVIRQHHVMNSLLVSVRDALAENCPENSTCTKVPWVVGWSSTDARHKYHPEDLETFTPNGKWWALRVKRNCRKFRAPATNQVTLVYEIKREPRQTAVIVHSMYPGPDVGELVGDVTRREDRVFFDWNHPGQAV